MPSFVNGDSKLTRMVVQFVLVNKNQIVPQESNPLRAKLILVLWFAHKLTHVKFQTVEIVLHIIMMLMELRFVNLVLK